MFLHILQTHCLNDKEEGNGCLSVTEVYYYRSAIAANEWRLTLSTKKNFST